jgi:hypothetical protein
MQPMLGHARLEAKVRGSAVGQMGVGLGVGLDRNLRVSRSAKTTRSEGPYRCARRPAARAASIWRGSEVGPREDAPDGNSVRLERAENHVRCFVHERRTRIVPTSRRSSSP